MIGRAYKSLLVSVAILAIIAVVWVGLGRLGQTRAYFSDTVQTSATFKVGAWQLPPLWAYVDIKPESLQKKAHGNPVTVFIELPDGFDVRNIDPGSVRLVLGTDPDPAGLSPTGKSQVNDHRLKVTFARSAVIKLVENVRPPATVTFTVSGLVSSISGNRDFVGSDTVKLVDPSRSPAPIPSETEMPEATVTPTATVTGTRTIPPSEPTVEPEETVEPQETGSPSSTPAGSAAPETPATSSPEETELPSGTPVATETPFPEETAVPSEAPEASPTDDDVPVPTPEGVPVTSTASQEPEATPSAGGEIE